jgi:hypothetical protein
MIPTPIMIPHHHYPVPITPRGNQHAQHNVIKQSAPLPTESNDNTVASPTPIDQSLDEWQWAPKSSTKPYEGFKGRGLQCNNKWNNNNNKCQS